MFLISSSARADDAPGPKAETPRRVSVVGGTSIVGDTDAVLWRSVLDVLPDRPALVVVVDAASLPAAARQRLHGLEAFVLEGHPALFVVRQAATLRQAALGDASDRLVLASVLWHEMAHARGLDEDGALAAEQVLWRGFAAAGRVDPSLGLAYIQRLGDEKRKAARPSILRASPEGAREKHQPQRSARAPR